jgi:hypothetical protein
MKTKIIVQISFPLEVQDLQNFLGASELSFEEERMVSSMLYSPIHLEVPQPIALTLLLLNPRLS